MILMAELWYRRAADTREVSSYFISIMVIIFEFQYITLVSAAHRYQGTLVIKFISFMSYRRPADIVGIQKDRCVHLHYIGRLRCLVDGSDLLEPVLSTAIGGSIFRMGGLSEHPLLDDSADTVASANTTLPRCALEFTQMNWYDIPICVRTKKLFANPSY